MNDMGPRITYIAALLSFLALCAWGIVGYASFEIHRVAKERAERARIAEQEGNRAAYSQRISVLAAETETDRARLKGLVDKDVVSIIEAIEAAGRSARVSARVSDAVPAGGAEEIPGGGEMQAVEFIVQATGSFASLMQAAALFEKIPLAASLQQIEFERNASDQGPPWRMTARIQVLTTALPS